MVLGSVVNRPSRAAPMAFFLFLQQIPIERTFAVVRLPLSLPLAFPFYYYFRTPSVQGVSLPAR